ncbi:MAG TPA: DUF1549 domain-containing protein [Pirellulales bacterium]|nr:DUF1549 domain-containing protein [Pirellulales bacterium]
MSRIVAGTVVFLFTLTVPSEATAGEAAPSPSFEQQVRPIFKAHCFACHGEGVELNGALDLRLRRLIAQGGDSGPAVIAGDAQGSLLLARVRAGEMPPGDKKLSPEEIETIAGWIAAGANTSRPEPESPAAEITPEEQSFWSFQPIARPWVPQPRGTDRVRTPIDAFLLARLEENGLTFSPEADRPTLLRRVFFDLLGLPPTPRDVAAFMADESPDAFERLVDGLLESPAYGERWARHWLDVAGYADSDGYTAEDPQRPYAYKYRDYVIRSFNADKPFDQFVQEQLAGDEMLKPPYQDLSPPDVDRLIATGFLRMGPDGTGSGGVDQDLARNQVVADAIKIVSTTLLGLTVGCAQCHNHRFDPIPQADYYRLRAIFEPAYDWKNWRPPQARLVSLQSDDERRKSAQIEAEAAKLDAERLKKSQEYVDRVFENELMKLPAEIRDAVRAARSAPVDKRTPEQQQLLKGHPSVNVDHGSLYLYDPKAAEDLKQMATQVAELRKTKPVEEFVQALTEPAGAAPTTFVFYRGDIQQPKQAVGPGELSVLGACRPTEIPADDPVLPTTGRRLAFARRLTDGTHPLVGRVLVNRVWLHYFGRGIVGTAGDFGFLGERPTHPELLDWLASDFVAGGWRLKRLHKLIVTSTAYRQQSRRTAAGEAADPENRLLWCMPIRRLEAEVVRDAVLATAGKLNDKLYGKPVPVMEDEVGQIVVGIENLNGENRPGEIMPLNGEEFRRSLYVQVRRTRPLAVLDAFDLPVMEPNCDCRTHSTVAGQSLMLMNSEFMLALAAHFAERVAAEAGADPRNQIVHAWRLAFASEPAEVEVTAALRFVADQTEQFRANQAEEKPADGATAKPGPQRQALSCFCQALLSSNAFLYVE